MKSTLLFCAFSLLFLFACNSSKNLSNTDSPAPAPNLIENPDISISLVDHLRKVTGVTVRGNGPDASVLIRGVSSINGNTEPLFVVNGVVLTGGLAAATEVVPVNNIKSIRVLKSPSETGIYGMQGANGVIKIALKN